MVRTDERLPLRLSPCKDGRWGPWHLKHQYQNSTSEKKQDSKSTSQTRRRSTETWWTWSHSEQLLGQSIYPVMWGRRPLHLWLRSTKHGQNFWEPRLMARSLLWRRWTRATIYGWNNPARYSLISICVEYNSQEFSCPKKQGNREEQQGRSKTWNAEGSAMHIKPKITYYNNVKQPMLPDVHATMEKCTWKAGSWKGMARKFVRNQ